MVSYVLRNFVIVLVLMPSFTIVKNLDNLPTAGWKPVLHFKSKGKIVFFEGRAFELSYKEERPFTFGERVVRALAGVLALLSTLGAGCLLRFVRKLFTKETATKRYAISVHNPNQSQRKGNTEMDPPPLALELLDLNLPPLPEPERVNLEAGEKLL